MTKLFRCIAILPIRIYKYCISPMLPPACRFVPTCSEYAMEAIARHGIFRGGLYAFWRILRCTPLSRGGYDPVPPPLGKRPSFEAKSRNGWRADAPNDHPAGWSPLPVIARNHRSR